MASTEFWGRAKAAKSCAACRKPVAVGELAYIYRQGITVSERVRGAHSVAPWRVMHEQCALKSNAPQPPRAANG